MIGLKRRAQSAIVRTAAYAAMLALFAGGLSAQAQTVTTAVTGHLTGPDRTARLIAGAKKEGSVTVYSSATVADMTPVVRAFEKKYPGVRVNIWRGASGDILQRTLTEARAGRNAVDVVETAAPDVEPLAREGLLQEVQSPYFVQLMPQAVKAGRPWVGTRIIVFTLAYNTNLIRPSQLPKSFADLADPKWKGKLGVEGTDANWYMALVNALGEQKGAALFRKIVTTNGVSVRKGHSLLANLVASGEVPLALNVYRHEVEPIKKEGAPIDELYLPPVIGMLSAEAVAKKAPHPYAAMLFYDFLLSDAQKIWAANDTVPTNVQYQILPKGVTLTFMNVPKYIDESAKWENAYRAALSDQPR